MSLDRYEEWWITTTLRENHEAPWVTAVVLCVVIALIAGALVGLAWVGLLVWGLL